MKRYISRVFLLLLLFSSSLMAEVIIDSTDQNIELLGVPFYEDESTALSLEEIQNKSFSVHKDTMASFGFTSSAYWFKISLEPTENASLHTWWLDVSYPLLDKLDLYICDENDTLIKVKKSGKARPFSEREAKDRHFLFKLDMDEKQILYLRVETQSSMQVPIYIQSSESLFSSEQYILVLSGLYYGIFVLIFFYNLISFIYTRTRNYFLYLVFISSFSIYQLSLDGLGMRFIWSDFQWMITHGNGTLMGLMILAIITFSRDFLKTREFTPIIDKILTLITSIMLVVTVLATFRPYGELILWIAGISIILPPLLLTTGILVYRKKFYPARFYIVGWGCFLTGSALFAINKFAWVGGYNFLSYAQQIGSALEMIFISWALADLQKQSEREYLNKLSGLNTLLQEKVDESLTQMRQNDQVLIEKSRLAAMGEMIEQIAHQWRQPLQTLALINQNLYFKVQLATVKKEDYIESHDRTNEQLQYMSQTIDDFRNFSQPNKEKELFVIEDVINSALNLSEGSLKYAKIKGHNFSEGEHSVFGMRHEMMQVFMNLIKNVQDVVVQKNIEEAWIKFFVKEKEDKVYIMVEDNAGGIDESKIESVFKPYFSTKQQLEGTGIGLYMSKEIIEKSMLGTISVTNSINGALFTIALPKVSLDKS